MFYLFIALGACGPLVSLATQEDRRQPYKLLSFLPDRPSDQNPLEPVFEIKNGFTVVIPSARAAALKRALTYISDYIHEHSRSCLATEQGRRAFFIEAQLFSEISRFLIDLDRSMQPGVLPRLVLKPQGLFKIGNKVKNYVGDKFSAFNAYSELFSREDRLLVQAFEALSESLFGQRLVSNGDKDEKSWETISELCQIRTQQDFLGPAIYADRREVFVKDPDGTRHALTPDTFIQTEKYSHAYLWIPISDARSQIDDVRVELLPLLGTIELVEKKGDGLLFKIPLPKGMFESVALMQIYAKDRMGNFTISYPKEGTLFKLLGEVKDEVPPQARLEELDVWLIDAKKPVLVNRPEVIGISGGSDSEIPRIPAGSKVRVTIPVTDDLSGVVSVAAEVHRKTGVFIYRSHSPSNKIEFEFDIPVKSEAQTYKLVVHLSDAARNIRTYPIQPLMEILPKSDVADAKPNEASSFSLLVPTENGFENLEKSKWSSLAPGSLVRLAFSLSDPKQVDWVSVMFERTEKGTFSFLSYPCEIVQSKVRCPIPTSVFRSQYRLVRVDIKNLSEDVSQLPPKEDISFFTTPIATSLDPYFFLEENFSRVLTSEATAVVQSWINPLTDEDYTLREQAVRQLAREIEWVYPLLVEEWERTEDAEMRWRIRKVLQTPFPSSLRPQTEFRFLP